MAMPEASSTALIGAAWWCCASSQRRCPRGRAVRKQFLDAFCAGQAFGRVRRELGLSFEGVALISSTECADLGALAIPGRTPATGSGDLSGPRKPAPRYFGGLPVLF